MQLPVDDAISLQLSLKIPNMLFFPTVKLSFKLSQMHQMQILPTKKVGQWSEVTNQKQLFDGHPHSTNIVFAFYVLFVGRP